MVPDQTLDLINATVQIEQVQPDGKRTAGTGFLVNDPRPDGASRTVLVTAAHVLELMPGTEVRIGWRATGEGGRWSYTPAPLTVRGPGGPLWTRDPDHDVAVIEVAAPPEFARAAIPLAWLADQELDRYGVRPGEEAATLGFPRGLAANRAGFPILRVGRVASWPLAPAGEFPTFLVDFAVFPGNSGGPVFLARPGATGAAASAPPLVVGVLTQEVELNDERLRMGVVTQAPFVRKTLQLLDAVPPGAVAGAPAAGPAVRPPGSRP
jgi:S1-C subfamily serine protease